MAPRQGPGADHLSHLQGLSRDPGRYHIFLALRMIEAQYSDAPRLGQSRRPREDRVRLGQEPFLGFAPVTIGAFKPADGAGPGRLTNFFFGFFGPHGPLPSHLTEYARDRLRNYRDPTFTAFADMLTHRLMTLLYRAWATGQPVVGLDRGAGGGSERRVAALAGFGGPAHNGRDAMPDMARRHFAAHLLRSVKNAAGLESLVSSFFDAPVKVEQFVGSWLHLEPGDRWQLGRPARLGESTCIGDRVWSRTAKFRLRIGPMRLEDYRALLPGEGGGLERLVALVRAYVGDALEWDVNLVLRGQDVPAARLGGDVRLGQTSWIGTRGAGDAEDLFLSPMTMQAKGAGPAGPTDAARGVMQ
jgi:type VI secretion system protein ImpH